jgi:hypothetical protein
MTFNDRINNGVARSSSVDTIERNIVIVGHKDGSQDKSKREPLSVFETNIVIDIRVTSHPM